MSKKKAINAQSKLSSNICHTDLEFAILNATPDALIICNQESEIVYVNQAVEKTFGYKPDELMDQKIEFLIPDRFAKHHVILRNNYMKNPYPRAMSSKMDLYGKHKNGLDIPVEIALGPVQLEDGLLIIVLIKDMTERKRAEKLLAESEARWKFALESGNQGVWDWAVPEKKIYFSHTWKKMLGYKDNEITDNPSEFNSRVHPDDLVNVLKKIQNLFKGKTKEYNCEIRFRCKDGHYKWILNRGKIISRDSNGNVLRAIGTHTDITEIKEKELSLKNLAEHDPLTGLINRRTFEDRLHQGISLAKRNQSGVAVCFLDLDNFKNINDQYTHAIGDRLLLAATKRIQESIREIDSLSRLGGDEFTLLFLNIKNKTDVSKILKKIMANFQKGFLIENIFLEVSLSIGVALYPEDGNTLLIEKADTAMYAAKKAGKNDFEFFDSKTMS